MRKLIWVFLLFPFFGIEAQENIRVNADPEAARYYFVLNNEGLSPYRNGRVAFFKNGKAYTAVLNEKLEKNDIKPAPELDGLGIEGLSSRNAQAVGYNIGYRTNSPIQQHRNLTNSINSGLKRLWNWMTK